MRFVKEKINIGALLVSIIMSTIAVDIMILIVSPLLYLISTLPSYFLILGIILSISMFCVPIYYGILIFKKAYMYLNKELQDK